MIGMRGARVRSTKDIVHIVSMWVANKRSLISLRK